MISQEQIADIKRRGKKFEYLLAQLNNPERQDRKALQYQLEQEQAKLNAINKIMPSLTPAEKKRQIAQAKPISNNIASIKDLLSKISETKYPNSPKPDVPDGDDESDNVVEREVGKKKSISHPKPYLDLAEPLGLIDMQRGSKVSGSRFGYLLGPLAQMEFALIQYAQKKLLTEANHFTMVVPPVMIKDEQMAAMGYLHGAGEGDAYHLEKDGLYLVGTSEQSIGPMHSGEIFSEADLPKRYLSFSTCFRREAGSYGQDTKGIIRVHQFDKLEMFSFTLPELSDQEHAWLLSLEESLWQGLEIPYQVMKLCTGDLSWPSARTWDINAWMPGQNKYREVSSTSNTTDYQSRALNIKVSRAGKKEFVHMLNGTAFAIGRTLIAIIENYQQPDGSIAVPKVLQPYLPFKKISGMNG